MNSLQIRTLLSIFLVITIPLIPFTSIGADNIDAKIATLIDTAEAFQAVSQKAKDAVVYVYVKKVTADNTAERNASKEFFNDPLLNNFFGEGTNNVPDTRDKQTTYAHGSGFIINNNGYILTNSHVINNAEEVTVRLIDKREFTARIIGQDQKSDVALIKIEAEDLPVISLGDSSSLKVGEWAIAIGSPFEMIQTVTAGIISATGRSSVGISEYEDFIQTDAAINPGNSGGPLLNIHGQVIGINTAFMTQTGGYMGVGFAIPINMANIIAERLQKDGKMTRAWLGVALKDISPTLLKAKKLNSNANNAALVSKIRENSPASSSLQVEDLIVSMNDIGIAGAADLRNRIALSAPGTTITLQFLRDGQKMSTTVALGAKEAED
ncbi:MAG: trypsin-like peptidase domain-containing protein [Proteobacteria bacterium]|jgi:serine protease Do|nr:trypsin-like serine protease [Desulfocapsa sp.]MBU3945162.1 trypsin-like peptidase domain-containing protein [Pseudomonadota bacterium]MCG2745808.1 trypsin-like peptidase domain-containing protein [Desulfobacteraceae bacterium]MBU4028030.1 trypsin-like peptidase domain-containing protein [Pseudomonadota bacterium]MBU4041501.1 trypsin-like peptidase domain-containing protein [Pseudomonadota bacterium]